MIRASEFQLDPARIQIFLIEPLGPSLTSLISKLDEDPGLQTVVFDSVAAAFKVLRQFDHCLVLGHISDSKRFIEYFNFSKFFAPVFRAGKMKLILVYPRAAAGKLPLEKLQMHGIQDLLGEPVPERTLLFKVTRAVKMLPKRRAGGSGSSESVDDHGRKRPDHKILQHEPIPIQSEVFLLTGGGAKRVQDRWTIRLSGPSPQSGRWVETTARTEGQKSWEFQPVDPAQDSLHKEEGLWTFSGQKPPEYSGDYWWFSGQSPLLEFVYDQQAYAKKFEIDPAGALSVARDSDRAEEVGLEIQKTFKKQYRKHDVQSAGPTITNEPAYEPPSEMEASPVVMEASGMVLPSSQVAVFESAGSGDGADVGASDVGLDLSSRVSPLQMHFLASELVRKRTSSGAEMAKRFCGFLSRALSDAKRTVHVELWMEDQSKWLCVAANDGRLSQLQMSVRKAGHEGLSEKDIVISGTFADEALSHVGRLAIQGVGVASIAPMALKDVGEAAVGILLSVAEDRDPRKGLRPVYESGRLQ